MNRFKPAFYLLAFLCSGAGLMLMFIVSWKLALGLVLFTIGENINKELKK